MNGEAGHAPGPTGTLVNGLAADRISTLDRSVQYGDGLFETVAVCAGRPLLWGRHVERLRSGCLRLGMEAPGEAELLADIECLCRGSGRTVIKIIVTRGCAGRGYAPPRPASPTRIVIAWPWPDYPAHNAHRGVAVRWCHTPASVNPAMAGIKHLNRLEQVLARAEWDREYAEGLMCDPDGFVVEGTMSNLFAVSGGTLMTPDLSCSGIAGVMRAEVIAAARRLGLCCEEVRITAAGLEGMDEIFLTNSIIGLWPVTTLATRGYAIGQVTQAVRGAIREVQCFDTSTAGPDELRTID